ncbi:MAG TPA: hypothetical protein VK809_00770 [Bacteroidia bacterium]|nr:hypothetical protein [Bacteroidia bacterium]
MKKPIQLIKHLAIATAVTAGLSATAQQQMQYFRPDNKDGLHMFETTKNDTNIFKKIKVQVGGNFEMSFQGLRDQNSAIPVTQAPYVGNVTSLIPLNSGFDLPMANLNIDAQLADGIRMDLTVYLASRHHEDVWVKGGYIQFDKLLFLKSNFVNTIMKSVTIKVGQFDVDYGDQHYQRSDGGNTIYNPFIENYIMDEFATEIGAEVYYHSNCGLFAMGGITNGELDPTVIAATKIDSATHNQNAYDPAFHAKVGYDKQISSNFRLRLTASGYIDQSANSNTLFGGDRTGSHYFSVMSNQSIANGTVLSNANDYNAFSGRYNPGFSEQVKTLMGNLLLTYCGLEFFGTYEIAQGRTITEKTDRQVYQYAGDLIYRFPGHKENFWVGVRYNTVRAAVLGDPANITINREAASVGWFATKNIMLKAEYVIQTYSNYPDNNILNGGRFDGYMVEASIGF